MNGQSIDFNKLALWRSRVEYQGMILGLICALVTLLLLIVQQKTFEPIQLRLEEDRQAILAQVLPKEYYDNNPLDEAYEISDKLFSPEPVNVYFAEKSGEFSAVVYQIQAEGYGGTITLMLAVNNSAEIVGLRTLSHKETPGLADKIEIDKSDWVTLFNGESLIKTPEAQWAVKKDGGKFDQFTGATITPRAIVNSVVEGLKFYDRNSTSFSKIHDSKLGNLPIEE